MEQNYVTVALCTLCPKKVSPLNILQQPPQTCTDLNEILHTQDDIYFVIDVKFHKNPLVIPFTRCSILSNCCHKSQLLILLLHYDRCQIRDVDHLKERLIEEWRRFDRNIIDIAVNQWRDRLHNCVRAKGGHFEHLI